MKIITIFFILILLSRYTVASYVTHATTVEAVPFEQGYQFNDGRGNSFSYTETTHVPVIMKRYPYGTWVTVKAGYLPYNSIVMRYVNGQPIYYCRAKVGSQVVYGEVHSRIGCVFVGSRGGYSASFQVLVK
jgi:hypothetical protein